MELLAIVLSGLVAFVASLVYAFVLAKRVVRLARLNRVLRLASVVVLLAVATELVLLLTLGAVGNFPALGPRFYLAHVLIFFLGPPALANVLVLGRWTLFRRHWYLAAPMCAAFAAGLVLLHPHVSVSLCGDVTRFETCAICQSTRALSDAGERVLYRSPTFNHGPHVWRKGLDMADSKPVPIGVVVLVKRIPPGGGAPTYGAVVLTEMLRERVSYRWYLRSDGRGALDPSGPAVRKGEVYGQSAIRFGPFVVHWSGSAEGAGYVYYDRLSHSPRDRDTTYLCVTDLRSLNGVDGADPKWHYRSSVAD